MKVSELIEKLKALPQDEEIYCMDSDCGGYDTENQPVTKVELAEEFGGEQCRMVWTIQGSYKEQDY